MIARRRIAGFALCLSISGADPTFAQELDPSAVVHALEQAMQMAASRAESGVVSVGRLSDEDRRPVLLGPFGAQLPALQPNWREFFGTGVVITDPEHAQERFVLTNRHVVLEGLTGVDGHPRLVVVVPGPREISADVVAADPRSDLAILRLDLAAKQIAPADVRPLEFGDAGSIAKGNMVVLLGNPYAVARDGSASLTIATVANLSRSPWRGLRRSTGDEDLTIHHLGTLWHLDARINLGSSGGAVVDFEGRLVGLTTSLAALEGYESSVGYAIPLTPGFQRIVKSLLRGFEVEYGFLGIAPRTSTQRIEWKEGAPPGTAAEVLTVASGSPADQAGIRPGDLIVAVDDVPVRGDDDLVREIGLLGPEATAQLDVLRPRGAGQLRSRVEVRLGKWPVYDDTAILATRKRREAWRGLEVDYPTARRRYITTQLFERYPQAVVITGVAPGSPTAAAGLQEGQFVESVNGAPTPTPRQFLEAAANVSGAVRLRLDDGREITITE